MGHRIYRAGLRALAWCAALGLLAPSRLSAQPVDAAVRVEVSSDATGCLTSEALQAQLRMWLSGDTTLSEAEVRVVPGPSHERAELTLYQQGRPMGRRRFERLPKDCHQRTAAVGLAMAVALDRGLLRELSGEREPAAEPPAPRARARSWTALSAGLQYGMLPRYGLLASVGLGWDGVERPWGVRLYLGGTPRERVDIGRGSAETAALFGVVEACGRVEPGAGEHALSLCAGGLMGVQFARGAGFASSRTSRLPWLAVSTSADVRFRRADPAGLFLRVGAHVQVVEPELWVRDSVGAQLASVGLPRVGVSGLLGVWIRLPSPRHGKK